MASITPFSFSINSPSSGKNDSVIEAIIANKTKPPGALGQLESVAYQLAKMSDTDRVVLEKPTMVVFAADHGIAREGISIAPPEVTQQMVLNMLSGGAAINCFCKTVGMDIRLVDAGLLTPVEHANLIQQSLGRGTSNFSQGPAMPLASVYQGVSLGASISTNLAKSGCNIIGFGEMGIGNTSSASAIMAAITQYPLDDCVGAGTGISNEKQQLKHSLIGTALKLHAGSITNAQNHQEKIATILSCVGGFEIVQMIGAMLSAAENSMVILVDGFIASVAALVAISLYPKACEYMIFCHQSHEKGHAGLLAYLDQTALLNLNLRLGEGTGAALALPLIQAAANFYNDMASFDSAHINPV